MKPLLFVLLVIIIPGCTKPPDPESETRALVANITSAILEYRRSVGPLDETDNVQIFRALTGQDQSRHQVYYPYRNSKEAGRFLDFWQRDLKFFTDVRGNVIAWSAGADGTFSTSDDIYGNELPLIQKYLQEAKQAGSSDRATRGR